MRPVSSVPCDLSVDSIGCHRPAQLREGLCRGEGISGVMEKDMVQHTQAPRLLIFSLCFPVPAVRDHVLHATCELWFQGNSWRFEDTIFRGQSPQKEPEVLQFPCFDGACSYSNLFRPNKCVGLVQITSVPLIAVGVFCNGQEPPASFLLIVWHRKKSAQSFLLQAGRVWAGSAAQILGMS